ncbi:L-alanine exporter AlaE [Candidatus Woesearchaeota archaeon]|nr:L-alanine exporter AlaE [Candidatus Woesearchaeota archaeon]
MLESLVDGARAAYHTVQHNAAQAWNNVYSSSWNKTLTLENTAGERAAWWIREHSLATQGKVDNYSNTVYSFVVGSALDIIKTGLGPLEWLASRAANFLIGAATTKHYGIYRDFLYRITKTTDESFLLRKKALDMVVFITTQTPLYGLITFATTRGDLARVYEGIGGSVLLTPVFALTMNWALDKGREFFGLPTSAEKSHQALSSGNPGSYSA